MSYIYVDVDAARRCAAMIGAEAERFGALLGSAPEAYRGRIEDLRLKLEALRADLLKETETYAAADEKMKNLHLMTNEGGRTEHGQ